MASPALCKSLSRRLEANLIRFARPVVCMQRRHPSIVNVESAGQLNRIHVLFREYQISVDAPICFATFQAEVAGLPGVYAEPAGCLLLAEVEGRDAGCVALRPLEGDPDAAELKRLYVRPEFRGAGIGRVLVTRVIEFARDAGYQRIQLDTLETMQAAQRLYLSMGFQIVPLPEGHPREHPLLMELKL